MRARAASSPTCPAAPDSAAQVAPCDDPADRAEAWLDAAIPRDRRWPYEIRPILEAVLDRGSLFEIGRAWGRSIVTALARLDGLPVAVIASDPGQMGGTWTAAASRKMARLVELAETFRLPVVHFVDVGGFTIGSQAEKAGTIRDGTRAIATIYQSTVPWCAVILRRAFGVAGAGMIDHTRFRYRIAWPSGDWGSLPVEGGSRRPSRRRSRPRPTPRRPSARSVRGWSGCARRSGRPSAFMSRRSSRHRRRGAGSPSSQSSRRGALVVGTPGISLR